MLAYIYTWNPNDPCFEWKRPCFGGLNHQNRGQTGSRYIYWNPPQMNIHRWSSSVFSDLSIGNHKEITHVCSEESTAVTLFHPSIRQQKSSKLKGFGGLMRIRCNKLLYPMIHQEPILDIPDDSKKHS